MIYFYERQDNKKIYAKLESTKPK